MTDERAKSLVKDHWEAEVCGSRYGDTSAERSAMFAEIDAARYSQDYMLKDFAEFGSGAGKRVLEVGLGTGADFANWVRAGADAYGRDLTEASVTLVRERLALEGLHGDVGIGDAESLEFPDGFFDVYYSWGVLHHTPDTEQAIREAHRVLKPGGLMKIMIYHYPSVSALLVWLIHGPLRFEWISPRSAYALHVESPGTKVYTRSEARKMVHRQFGGAQVEISTYLGSGDLLTHKLSARYPSRRWRMATMLYPRWFVRQVLGHRFGTVMTVTAVK